MRIFFVLLFVTMLSACRPVCVDDACACNPSETCTFTCSGAPLKRCIFDCEAGAKCSGSYAEAVTVSCGGASCTHTVGAGSIVHCVTGTCTITCTGKCTVDGKETMLTCASGSPTATGCP